MSFRFFKQSNSACRALRAAFVLGALLMAGSVSAATCRVTLDGTSSGNGSNWGAQAMDLHTALASSACDEVWVKAGIYTPTDDGDRSASFTIGRNVQVYGGFFGNEAQRHARDAVAHPTVLSGDLDGDDDSHFSNVGDNSTHVVYVDGSISGEAITDSMVLDGFTISGGSAYGDSTNGGGLYCDGSSQECSPALSNLVFNRNGARLQGGAMYCDGRFGTSSPILSNVVFSDNMAEYDGGAMSNIAYEGVSSPTLNSVTFSNNEADSRAGAMLNDGVNGVSNPVLNNVTFDSNWSSKGGAIYNVDASPVLSNVIFMGNEGNKGGAMYNKNASPNLSDVSFSGNTVQRDGGAMFNDSYGAASNLTLDKVTFKDNEAGLNGGAMYNNSSNGICSPTLSNVTFSGNHSVRRGAAMYNNSGGSTSTTGTVSPTLNNVTFSGNTVGFTAPDQGVMYNNVTGNGITRPVLNNVIMWGSDTAPIFNEGTAASELNDSIVQDGCPVGSNCYGNMIYTDPLLGPLQDNGGFTQTMQPEVGSPAIDAGNNATCEATDQRGAARPYGDYCDIGAVEFLPDSIFADGFEVEPI